MFATARAFALAGAFVALSPAAAAFGAGRIYWSNYAANNANGGVRVGNLDGSGAPTTFFNADHGDGVALAPATGKAYAAWTQPFGTLGELGLDGSGLSPQPVSLFEDLPSSVDYSNGLVYWADFNSGLIRRATISGDTKTLYSDPNQPRAVAIDPAANRIYWADYGAGTINVGSLDDTTAAAPVFTGQTHVSGLALDAAAGKLYWSVAGAAIRSGSVSGGTVSTVYDTTSFPGLADPRGLALDPGAGRLYWADASSNQVVSASLSGGETPKALFSGESTPTFVALLEAPVLSAPTVDGGSVVGASLSCDGGVAADDLPGASLYRAPQSVGYAWLRDGALLTTAGTKITALSPGTYTCTVAATNAAGTVSQTSAPHVVSPAPAPPPPKPAPPVRLRIATLGGWTVGDKGVKIRKMAVTGLRSGLTVKLSCSCHVSQTLKATHSTLVLTKLKNKVVKRGKGFTITATAPGTIGDQLTLVVKPYGHTRKAFVKASTAPFRATHRCIPIGASKPAKSC